MKKNTKDTSRGTVQLLRHWQTALAAAIGVDGQFFKILLPAKFLRSNEELFELQDKIPVESDFWLSNLKSTSFFEQYNLLANLLRHKSDLLKGVLGKSKFKDWEKHLKGIHPSPAKNTWPSLFRSWAILHAPASANEGSSTLAQEILIEGAKGKTNLNKSTEQSRSRYKTDLAELLKKMNAASSKKVTISFDPNSLCAASDSDFEIANRTAGLFLNKSTGENFAEEFAQSEISLELTFGRFLMAKVEPGDWFDSKTFQRAITSKSSDWWSGFFGAAGSCRQRVGALIVASDIELIVTSKASFSAREQAVLQHRINEGCWPFYCPDQAGVWMNSVSFTNDSMTIRGKSQQGPALVFGGAIYPMGSD